MVVAVICSAWTSRAAADHDLSTAATSAIKTRIAIIELTWVKRGPISRVLVEFGLLDLTMKTSGPDIMKPLHDLSNRLDDSCGSFERSTASVDGLCASLSYKNLAMNKADLFIELVAAYGKHGWELKAALLQPTTRAELTTTGPDLLSLPKLREATFDALWFSRPSHNNRVAWELRLLAETQYALFETFEADETEEQREEMRLEMEARLREYVHGSNSERGH